MSRVRMTLMFEQVASDGEVITSEKHGAFINDIQAIESLATIAANTVREEFPEFLKEQK